MTTWRKNATIIREGWRIGKEARRAGLLFGAVFSSVAFSLNQNRLPVMHQPVGHNHFIGLVGCGESSQSLLFLQKSIDWLFGQAIVDSDVGDRVSPVDSQSSIVVDGLQFVFSACQRTAFDVADGVLDKPWQRQDLNQRRLICDQIELDKFLPSFG